MAIETSRFRRTRTKPSKFKGKKSQVSVFKVVIILFVLLPVLFYFTSGSSRNRFANYQMGKLFDKLGNHEKALDYFTSAYESSNRTDIQSQLKRAELYNKLSIYEKALTETDLLLEKNPVDNKFLSKVYLERGYALEGTEAWVDAMIAYTKSTQTDADNYFALIGLGRVKRIQGQYGESVQFLNNAISKRQLRAPEAHYELGLTYLALNQNSDALEEFDYTLSQMPSKELKQKAQDRKTETISK
jgi:tetratricopeptide (TPR) repeat protein